MVDFTIEGVAELVDRVSPELEKIRDELDKVSGDLRDGSEDADTYQRMLERMVPADELEAETQAVGEAIDGMVDSGDTTDIRAWKKEIRESTRSLINQSNLLSFNMRKVEKLGQEYSESAAEAAVFREQVQNAVPTHAPEEAKALDRAIDNIIDADEIGNFELLQQELRSTAVGFTKSQGRANEMADELEELIGATVGYSGAAASATAQTRGLSSALDEAGDEAEETTGVFEMLSPESAHLAANLGFLHISIGRMLKTLPQLAILFGGITKALGGMAVATAGATGAFVGLMGAGLLGWAEALDAQFASIEGTGQAMTVIFKALGSALRDALAPLMNARLADGTTAMQFMLNVMGGLVDVVRTLAAGFKEIIALEEVQSFFQTLGGGILGATAQSGGLAKMLDALKYATKKALPVVEEIMVKIGSKLPTMIRNWGDATVALEEELISFVVVMLDMLSVLSEVGVTLMQVALPPLTAFLAIMAEIGREINDWPDVMKRTAISVLLFGAVVQQISKYLVGFAGNLRALAVANPILALAGLTVVLLEMTNALDDAKVKFGEFLQMIPGIDKEMANKLSGNTIALMAFVYAISKAISKLGEFGYKIKDSKKAMKGLKLGWKGLKWAVRSFGKLLKWVGRIIRNPIGAISSLGSGLISIGRAFKLILGPGSRTARLLSWLYRGASALATAVGTTTSVIVGFIAIIVALIGVIGHLTGDFAEALRQFPMLEAGFNALLNPIESTKNAIAGLVGWFDRAINNFDSFIKKAKESRKSGNIVQFWLSMIMVTLAGVVKGFAMLWNGIKMVGSAAAGLIGGIDFSGWIGSFMEIVDKSNILRYAFEAVLWVLKIIIGIISVLAGLLLSPLVIIGLIITYWDDMVGWIKKVIGSTIEWLDWLTDIKSRMQDIKDLAPDMPDFSLGGGYRSVQPMAAQPRGSPQGQRGRGGGGGGQRQTNVTVNMNGDGTQEDAARAGRTAARNLNNTTMERDGYSGNNSSNN